MNQQSRYAKGTVAWVTHPKQGRTQVVHTAPLVWSNYPYKRFQPSSADSLPTLAFRTYGAAQDYWFIAAMNPQIECPDDVVPGDVIQIPLSKIW